MRQVLAFAVVALACQPAGESGTKVSAPDMHIQLHPWFRDLRVVHGVVGTDTLSLLLDTGGGATLVTPGVARRLGCIPRGSDVGHRMTGERIVFARCDSLRISSGAWAATLAPIAVFDVEALLPKELPHLDGVLSLDAFRGRVITVDWPAGSLTVRDAANADSAVARTGLTTRLATGESGRFLTALVSVQGTNELLWFLLDSGNLRGTLVSRTILRDSLLPLGTGGEAMLAIGGGNPIRFSFSVTDLILDGVLGTDFLQRGPVTLDLRAVRFQ